MSARGSRVPRPATGTQWHLRFCKRAAAAAWEEWANSQPGAVARCYDQFETDPRRRAARHHQLRGGLATGAHGGRTLDRRQHELTSGGRVWALIDDRTKTVWIEEVSQGHPARTGR